MNKAVPKTVQAVTRRLISLKQAALGPTRTGAILRTVLSLLLTRGVSIIASVLTVPLVLHYTGQERYGVWMAAIAITMLFAVADGGVCNGLIALVAKAHGAGDRVRMRALISSAFAVTAGFVLVFILAAITGVSLTDWTSVFNLSSPALGREAGSVVAVICLCMAASFPATVFREARLGLLQGARVNLWDFAGLVVGFLGLVAAIRFDLGLVAIAGIWAGAPTLARIVGAASFLAGSGRDLVPSWRYVELDASRSLLTSGGVYVLYSLTQMLAIQSAPILIARFLGAAEVADFTVVQKLFLQPQVLVAIGLIAQWPAYGEASGRGDLPWIKRHLTQSLAIYAVFAIGTCGLAGLFCNPILHLWVGGAIVAPPLLVWTMAVYGAVSALANVFAFFYLSTGMHRRLIVAQSLMVAITLPLSILLIPRIGSAGSVIASSAGFIFAFVLPGLAFKGRLLADLTRLHRGSNASAVCEPA